MPVIVRRAGGIVPFDSSGMAALGVEAVSPDSQEEAEKGTNTGSWPLYVPVLAWDLSFSAGLIRTPWVSPKTPA